MSSRDFALLALICFIWGLSLVVTRWIVADVPPLFYAFARFVGIALVLAPFVWPPPRGLSEVALVGACIGGLNFALLFLALRFGEASAVAIAGQLGLPFTTILSMAFLGERVGWRRGLGMGLAFLGVIVIAFDPSGLGLSLGVMLSIAAAFVGSVGGVLMKRMDSVPLMKLQAWVALVSVPIVLPLTLAFEPGAAGAALAAGWKFWGALAFSVLAVSVFGHGLYYALVQRYEVTLISPLTLMTPVWAVVLGVVLLGEPFSGRLALGAAIALSGVAMIAMRPNAHLKEAIAFFRRFTQ